MVVSPWSIALAFLAVVLVGCGSSATPPTPTVAERSPNASGELDLCATDHPCSLGAGIYAPTLFRPAIAFAIDAGWWNELYVADCITVYPITNETARLFMVSGVDALGKKPGDLAAFAASRNLAVSSQAAIRIAGREGLAIDVTTSNPMTLFPVAGMGIGLDPGQRARLMGISSDDGLFVVMLRAATPTFDRFAADAQPIIDSLQLR